MDDVGDVKYANFNDSAVFRVITSIYWGRARMGLYVQNQLETGFRLTSWVALNMLFSG